MWGAVMGLALVVPLALVAYERPEQGVGVETRSAIEVEADGAVEARAEQESSADARTNICDGVTCPDGSCAATREECVAEATISPDIYADHDREEREASEHRDTDSDGDTILDRDEALRIDPVDTDADGVPDFRDPDDDGDSIPAQAGSHNSSRSNETQGRLAPGMISGDDDEVEDEGDDIAPAQDYNSTRSNRRKNVFDDGDGDGWPELTVRGRTVVVSDDGDDDEEVDGTRVRAGDDLYCWGRAEAEDGRGFAWGRGLCVALDEDVDAGDPEARRIAAVRVRGEEVRAWSEEERSAWRAYRAAHPESGRHEDIADLALERSLSDERIVEMRADDESVAVTYRDRLMLLGFIPLERTIVARQRLGGEAEIPQPWYRFLATRPHHERIRALLSDTMDILVLVPERG